MDWRNTYSKVFFPRTVTRVWRWHQIFTQIPYSEVQYSKKNIYQLGIFLSSPKNLPISVHTWPLTLIKEISLAGNGEDMLHILLHTLSHLLCITGSLGYTRHRFVSLWYEDYNLLLYILPKKHLFQAFYSIIVVKWPKCALLMPQEAQKISQCAP